MITHCPKCESTNWRCWDERDEWFYDASDGEYYMFPVGYLKCKGCGHSWADTSNLISDECVWIGRVAPWERFE